jgi:alkanesulfonate monooxygenase SsuD/methylene tetrahydromethanopterin reductase-like flavin-dependent oxidoreductase (luciferase family)
MRQALFVAPFGELAEPSAFVEVAVAAEEHGWDGLFAWDHILRPADTPDIGDAWISMAAAAQATKRLIIGPMVTPLVRRRPQKVARETIALDRLSNGRLIMGVGLGVDSGGELTRFAELVDPVQRGDMLDEAAELLIALWSGDEVNHHGRYFTADGVRFAPGPVRGTRMPLWFAARGDARRPLRRAARLGDGVHAIEMDRDQLKRALDLIAEVRGSLAGFDVATNVDPGESPARWDGCGVTWAIHAFGPHATAAEVVAVIARGCPS